MRPQFVSVAVWNSLSPSKTHARLQVLQSIGCSRTAGESVSTHQCRLKNAATMGPYCGDLQGVFIFWEILFATCKNLDHTYDESRVSNHFGKHLLFKCFKLHSGHVATTPVSSPVVWLQTNIGSFTCRSEIVDVLKTM